MVTVSNRAKDMKDICMVISFTYSGHVFGLKQKQHQKTTQYVQPVTSDGRATRTVRHLSRMNPDLPIAQWRRILSSECEGVAAAPWTENKRRYIPRKCNKGEGIGKWHLQSSLGINEALPSVTKGPALTIKSIQPRRTLFKNVCIWLRI